jgi:hypothetical protein
VRGRATEATKQGTPKHVRNLISRAFTPPNQIADRRARATICHYTDFNTFNYNVINMIYIDMINMINMINIAFNYNTVTIVTTAASLALVSLIPLLAALHGRGEAVPEARSTAA